MLFRLFDSNYRSNRPVPFYCFYRPLFRPAVLLSLLLLLLLPLFWLFCHCCFDWLTAIDRLLPLIFLLPKVLLLDVLLLTNCYRVLLPSVLPLTVLFYFTALSICFYYYFCYCYCYCCYCCYRCYCYYCCRYYFWFTTVLVTTSRKIRS